MKRFLLIIVMVSALALGVGAAPTWEVVSRAPASEQTDQETEYEVRGLYLYISAPRPVQVKVFTILGQLVSQTTVPSGVSRLRLSQRGIYILKIGTATRRVTV